MKSLSVRLACALLAAASAFGQTTLVSFNFTSQTSAAATLTASTVAQNVTAGAFSVSDGSFTSTNFTTDSPPNSPAVSDQGSWSGASPTKYFSFTVAPTNGYQLSITGISFDYRQTSTGALNYQISIGSNTSAGSGTFNRDSQWYSISPTITTTTLTGLTEIRIYGYGGGNGTFAIDQVTLQGSVSAIPEPSTYAAFAGLSVLALAATRRRRRAASR